MSTVFALSTVVAIPVAALLLVQSNGVEQWSHPREGARKAAKRWGNIVEPSSRKGARRQGRRAGAGSGNAAVLLSGDLTNHVVGPLQVAGQYRAVESSKNLRARNLTIRQLVATGLQRDGVRLRGDIDGAQVSGFTLQMRSQPQSGGELPIGIAIQSGRRIRIADGTVRGFQMVRVPGEYTNGDGIAAERQVDDLTIRSVTASDNSDAGFDLKSKDTKLDQLRSERNGRNYRFWGSVEAGTLTSVDPRGAHVWAAKRAVVHIKRLIATSTTTAPLVLAEGGANVVIDSCELRLPRGTRLVKVASAGAHVSLGRGCK